MAISETNLYTRDNSVIFTGSPVHTGDNRVIFTTQNNSNVFVIILQVFSVCVQHGSYCSCGHVHWKRTFEDNCSGMVLPADRPCCQSDVISTFNYKSLLRLFTKSCSPKGYISRPLE